VRDDGAGISASATQMSRRNGLSLVRRLVKQAKGVLDMDADDGTVWRIKLPVAT
jgi:two-component sensor histidine kinase